MPLPAVMFPVSLIGFLRRNGGTVGTLQFPLLTHSGAKSFNLVGKQRSFTDWERNRILKKDKKEEIMAGR